MDFASLKDQVTNLTLYDLKAGVRKVQNGKSFGLTGKSNRNDRFTNPVHSSRYELYRDGSKGIKRC